MARNNESAFRCEFAECSAVEEKCTRIIATPLGAPDICERGDLCGRVVCVVCDVISMCAVACTVCVCVVSGSTLVGGGA